MKSRVIKLFLFFLSVFEIVLLFAIFFFFTQESDQIPLSSYDTDKEFFTKDEKISEIRFPFKEIDRDLFAPVQKSNLISILPAPKKEKVIFPGIDIRGFFLQTKKIYPTVDRIGRLAEKSLEKSFWQTLGKPYRLEKTENLVFSFSGKDKIIQKGEKFQNWTFSGFIDNKIIFVHESGEKEFITIVPEMFSMKRKQGALSYSHALPGEEPY